MNASVLWWPTVFQSNVSGSVQQDADASVPSFAFKLVIEEQVQ